MLLNRVTPTVRPELVEGRIPGRIRSWFDRLTTNGVRRTSCVCIKKGFTLAEIVIAAAVAAVVAAVALPSMLAMRIAANEGAVMEGMRAVVQACEQFRMQGTQGGVGEYPAALVAFTRVAPPYLDRRFDAVAAGGVWNGYRWRYVPGPRTSQRVGNRLFTFRGAYTLTADPVWRGVTGRRSFFTDQSGIIRSNLLGPAGSTDPAVE